MNDAQLRSLERLAHSGDFDAAVNLEMQIAKILDRCPCEGGCPRPTWIRCARAEVERDFDEHGGYRLDLNDILNDPRRNPDEELRELERKAKAGDLDAVVALKRRLERALDDGDAGAIAEYVHACRQLGIDHGYTDEAAGGGIDYGRYGGSNRNVGTGIHYGIISAHSLSEWFYDLVEYHYDPACYNCGEELADEIPEECPSCDIELEEDMCYGDEPSASVIDREGVQGFVDSYGDVWFTESPYYMRGTYCSPCAPGAVSIGSPTVDGPKAYCPPHSWYRDGVAPHLIFRVADGMIVYPEEQ